VTRLSSGQSGVRLSVQAKRPDRLWSPTQSPGQSVPAALAPRVKHWGVKLTTHLRTEQGLKCVELYLPAPHTQRHNVTSATVNSKYNSKEETALPRRHNNRLHIACRIKPNPKIRKVNVLEETCKKLPPLCKGYVQPLLIRSAQSHFCRLPVVQVTIIDGPPPKKKQGGYWLGNLLFKDEALLHLSGHIDSKKSTTWEC